MTVHLHPSQKVWTFQIIGGSDFSIQIPNNPKLVHNGSMSVYHFVGSDAVSDALFEALQEQEWGCRVERFAELETPEQTAYHQRYIEAESSLFPCMKCVGCFWLDLHSDGYCGFDAWSDDVRKFSQAFYSKAQEDVEACPLGKV